jgi:glyoxylase-like metal-dependent hydrolase (beta-lactamase superfamily II)
MALFFGGGSNQMPDTLHKPMVITPNLYQLGTPSFPAYLSMGEMGMIIEGGTGPTFGIIVNQIKALGIDPKRIRSIILTHSHADHIGGVPHLKREWPHLKLLASPVASEILTSKELLKEFLLVDLSIAQLMQARGELRKLPVQLESYSFKPDSVVRAGDKIELGAGIVWTVHDTPGHSACHISLYEEKEDFLAIGDAAGFYVPEKDVVWPNYFNSLENYCESIRKLSGLPARRAALSHNGIIQGDVKGHLTKAMRATENYHQELMQRLSMGEIAEKIALEKARFVSGLTDIQPFRVMYDLCKLMIKRSQTNGKKVSFSFSGPGQDCQEPVTEEKSPKTEIVRQKISPTGPPMRPLERKKPLSLNERLGLVALIDEGMRLGLPEAPMVADLFNDLWDLMNATVSGSKLDQLKPEDSKSGLRLFEINAESGENLGRLNMLYLKKPIPCYYLVYVEVAAPFRKRGLGTRILKYFRDFLVDKSALGILNNIIPSDDPTYDIYLKQSWKPIQTLIGNSFLDRDDHYMIFIPPALEGNDLKGPVLKLLHHLKRRLTAIHVRENEIMVGRTIAEFRDLYQTLLTYFEPEIRKGEASPFMRFIFTRFVTKLIAFRRRIGNLVGYTGGESIEQITLMPEVANLEVKSYAPRELVNKSALGNGELALLNRLPEDLKNKPASFIESLPNYRRPSFMAWLSEHGKSHSDLLTLGDLLDLGFDPTRLKEITLDNQEFIFERIQERQLSDLKKKNKLLDRIGSEMPTAKVRSAWLRTNPVLLVIRDRGNAYVLRRKISAIHWEEAIEQLQTHPHLRSLNSDIQTDQLLLATVRVAGEVIEDRLGLEKGTVPDQLTAFVPWDLENNHPNLVIDFEGTFLESLWMA